MRTTYRLGQTTDLAYSISLFVTIYTCHLSLMKCEENHVWASFAHEYGVNRPIQKTNVSLPSTEANPQNGA